MTDTLLILSPLLIVVVGALAMMIADAFSKDQDDLATTATIILLAAIGLSASLWFRGEVVPPTIVSDYLAVDRMSLVFDMVICSGTAFTALLAGGYLREHQLERGELYPLLLLSAFGAMVLARSTDLLSLFVGLETMSLGVYCLVAFRRTSARAGEGALKYFLLGSFAAAILLFGSALLYGATGQTHLAKIGAAITANEADMRLVVLSLVLIVVGLAFKVSAVPFHMWTPDAYEGAITPVTTFMSVAVKAAAFAVMVRVLLVAFADPRSMSLSAGWPPVVAGLSAVTMVYGNIAAVYQTSVKRMLAYSSIAHAGYIMIGVVAAWKLREPAISAVLFYLMAYTASNALAFGSLIYLGSRGKEAVSYEDLAGVGRRHPAAALPFVIGVLSLMGFPPTAGFFAKYYVLNAAVEAGGGLVWLAVLGVVTSAIGAYYYLRVLVYMFMKAPQPGAPIAVPMKSGYVVLALVLSGYFVLRMGLAPGNYLSMALEAAAKLV